MNKMEIKVGDYVRTKYGIAKIIDLKENPYGEKTIYILNKSIINIYDCDGGELACYNPFIEDMQNEFDTKFGDEKCIIKSSPNIIDLIEVGDLVNGSWVNKIKDGKPYHEDSNDPYYSYYYEENDIYTVLTKEQYKNTRYKVE